MSAEPRANRVGRAMLVDGAIAGAWILLVAVLADLTIEDVWTRRAVLLAGIVSAQVLACVAVRRLTREQQAFERNGRVG
jgi:hypothetical protein